VREFKIESPYILRRNGRATTVHRLLSRLHNCQQSWRSQSETRNPIPSDLGQQVSGGIQPFCRMQNQRLRRKNCPEVEDETIRTWKMGTVSNSASAATTSGSQHGERAYQVAERQLHRLCATRGAGRVHYGRRVRLMDHHIIPGDHAAAVVVVLLQERGMSRNQEVRY
jgi:hypothetical protein